MTTETTPSTEQNGKPGRVQKRDRPDWPTCRGYLGIALGTLFAFFLTARATGGAQIVFILIWIACIGAIVSFTKYDRRRRIRKEQS